MSLHNELLNKEYKTPRIETVWLGESVLQDMLAKHAGVLIPLHPFSSREV